MCYRVPCRKNWWKQFGKSTEWKIFDESPACRDIYLQDQTGWRWTHFCTRNSDMGKIFSRLWSNGFHCQKVNVDIIANHLISSTVQINWFSTNSIFKYIAWVLRSFLLQYHTSKPMIPFIAVESDVTFRQLTSLVAKSKVVSDANTPICFCNLI